MTVFIRLTQHNQVQATSGTKMFTYDKVFNENSTQKDVFEQLQVNYLVKRVIEGYNSTIFVYGQTGSGKTYTMEGYEYTLAEQNTTTGKVKTMSPIIADEENVGIAVRTIKEFYKQKAKIKDHLRSQFSFFISFFQIYNEKVYDLLNFTKLNHSGARKKLSQQNDLKLRWNQDQFVVENLFMYECETAQEAITLYNQGIKNKIVSSHQMNHASSRSHCIFSLQVEFTPTEKMHKAATVSKMFLVDLAGSERISFIGEVDKVTQKETIQINQSLMILRKVIGALARNDNGESMRHIPYRESKLTSVLKQSLGGNSYCLMIACISPSDFNYEENQQTLNYALKANIVQNKPVKNKQAGTVQRMENLDTLKEKNRRLEEQLKKARKKIDQLSNNDGSRSASDLSTVTPPTKLLEKEQKQEFYDNMMSSVSNKLTPLNPTYKPIRNYNLQRRQEHGDLLQEVQNALEQGLPISNKSRQVLIKILESRQGKSQKSQPIVKQNFVTPSQSDIEVMRVKRSQSKEEDDLQQRSFSVLEDRDKTPTPELRFVRDSNRNTIKFSHIKQALQSLEGKQLPHLTKKSNYNTNQTLNFNPVQNPENSFIYCSPKYCTKVQYSPGSIRSKTSDHREYKVSLNSNEHPLTRQNLQEVAKLSPNQGNNLDLKISNRYKHFPDQFYENGNENYDKYKEIEQKIYENRSKLLSIKQILRKANPGQATELSNVSDTSTSIYDKNYSSSSKVDEYKPEKSGYQSIFSGLNFPRYAMGGVKDSREDPVSTKSLDRSTRTFGNQSLLAQQLKRQPQGVYVTNLPLGVRSILFNDGKQLSAGLTNTQPRQDTPKVDTLSNQDKISDAPFASKLSNLAPIRVQSNKQNSAIASNIRVTNREEYNNKSILRSFRSSRKFETDHEN